MSRVRIPPTLRPETGGEREVEAAGATIGQLHRFINLYRPGEDIRYLSQLETQVDDGNVVAILPAVAGG